GGTAGLTAVYDDALDASPLITAIVRSDPGGSGSSISLSVFQSDIDDTPDFEDTFYADNDASVTWCRHPAVEVAYCHPDDATQGIDGYIFIYIVWAQLNDYDNEGIDLYYKRYIVDFDGTINWSTDVTVGNEILLAETQGANGSDDVQPDLAMKLDGDLLLAYVRTEYTNFDESDILAIEADYDDSDPTSSLSWGTIYSVSPPFSGLPNARNIAPSIDVGMVDGFDNGENDSAVCVWSSQLYWGQSSPFSPQPYLVWANAWDSEGTATPVNSFAITSGDPYADALAKVDIVPIPPSIGLGESPYQAAIISWTHFDWSVDGYPEHWGDQHFEDPVIQMTISPELSGALLTISDEYGIAPDIACYERGSNQDQWFGLTYYYANTGGDIGDWDWDGIRVTSYSFDTDQTITKELTWIEDNYAPAFWALLSPFTGPTICLRDPSPEDTDNEPVYDIFFIGLIQDGDPDLVWISDGTIQP
ncbi:MAG TPA: hypothetical protein VGB30_02345, partial [bacterium]